MAESIQAMGGSSTIGGNAGFVVLGENHARITDSEDDFPGARQLIAEIRAEAEIPYGKTGDVSVSWDVPEGASTALTVDESNYDMMVSAYGSVAVELSKSTTTGRAYSSAEIRSSVAAANDMGISIPFAYGNAILDSEVFLSGTGTASSSVEGAASYSASVSSGGAGTDRDVLVDGSAEGTISLTAETVNGGTIHEVYASDPENPAAYMDGPAYAYIDLSSMAVPGLLEVVSNNEIGLGATRNAIRSGTTTAEATLSGTTAATAEINFIPGVSSAAITDSQTAVVGCSDDGPISVDSSASVSAPAKSDKAYAYTELETGAFSISVLFESAAYAWNDMVTFSQVNRPSACCVSGDMVMAFSEITDAVWDVDATNDASQAEDPSEVCISGATGLTRDGDPDVATEPGFATGATSVNRNEVIKSFTSAHQQAVASDAMLSTVSSTDLYIQGPKYSDASGNVDDAAGARFAIDYMTMGASNGIPVLFGGDTALATNIAGPDAFIWITSADVQLINGHYADDGISIYEVEYTPLGFGMTNGPEIIGGDTGMGSRYLGLLYTTDQMY